MGKIVIISQRSGEETTNKIIDWIRHYKGEYHRINGIDFLKNCDFKILSNEHKSPDILNILPDYSSVLWFRRWLSYGDLRKLFIDTWGVRSTERLKATVQINSFMIQEAQCILEYLFASLPDKIKIYDNIDTKEINKLIVLQKAVALGLVVPHTAVQSSKNSIGECKGKIVKPVSNGFSVDVDNKSFKSYTSRLEAELLPEVFFPSKIQSEVLKVFEIRAFLLNNKIYAMAIFSQENEQTNIDFRKYDYDKPNRVTPFNLPHDICEKLTKLGEFFQLATASFDLIMSKSGEYVFLEVNPGGQFGMVSTPCNYYLEEKVATHLINLSNEK